MFITSAVHALQQFHVTENKEKRDEPLANATVDSFGSMVYKIPS